MEIKDSAIISKLDNLQKFQCVTNRSALKSPSLTYDIKDSFVRNNAKVLSFGAGVTKTQKANKDFDNIKMGSHYNPLTKSLDFGIFSIGTRMELCLFRKPNGEQEIARIPMIPTKSDRWVHSISKDKIQELLNINLESKQDKDKPVYYGYRVWGSNWDYQDNWQPGTEIGSHTIYDNNWNPIILKQALDPQKGRSVDVTTGTYDIIFDYKRTPVIINQNNNQIKYSVENGNLIEEINNQKNVVKTNSGENIKVDSVWDKEQNKWIEAKEGKYPVFYDEKGFPVLDKSNQHTGFILKDGKLKGHGVRDRDVIGNRFNPNKLLSDYYSYETSHDTLTPGVSENGYDFMSGEGNRQKDSAKVASKSIYTRELEKISEEGTLKSVPDLSKPFTDQVYYEAQVWGLTKNLNKDVLKRLYKKELKEEEGKPEKEQKITTLVNSWKDEYAGTYKGAAFLARHLKNLGITTVEFMPIMSFQNAMPGEEGGWGYMTDSFMAPDRELAYDSKTPGGPTKEFKQMVEAFNKEGVEVCMDVVYNHTGEGGVDGKNPDATTITSLKGYANPHFYLMPKDRRYYHNASGCGNDTNSLAPRFQNLVVDSLKRWAKLGVSAFRFDLAPLLANGNPNGDGVWFDRNHLLLKKIEKELPVRSKENKDGVVLIAEPWAADGTVVQGGFPENWKEWNGLHFRDSIRESINHIHDDSSRPAAVNIIRNLAGSKEGLGGTNPRSVNFITCHDGFTLYDLFAYNNKHNPKDPLSGDSHNRSWNQYDGIYDTKEKAFTERGKAVQTALGLLMTSVGAPMLLYGDERFNTKDGCNNSYNEHEKNALKWDSIVKNTDEKGNEQVLNADNLSEFTKRLINFRHNHNALHPDRYFYGEDKNGKNGKDVTWLDRHGNDMWDNRDFLFGKKFFEWQDVVAYKIDGTEEHLNDKSPSIYVAYNRGIEALDVKMPAHQKGGGKSWHKVLDTSIPVTDPNNPEKELEKLKKQSICREGEEIPVKGDSLKLEPRSFVVLIEK